MTDGRFKKGQKPWNTGLKLDDEYREKLIKAHKEFHKIYGFKNNSMQQLEEFLNMK